jgi:hypothetical protein
MHAEHSIVRIVCFAGRAAKMSRAALLVTAGHRAFS